MPKIRDLGIKVIPETMKPPEIGGGGGCSDCTVQQFSICGTTPGGGGGGCTDCTVQAFSICGTTPGPQVCTDCTNVPFSICGGTQCGFITHRGCGNPWTFCGCSVRVSVVCQASVACGPQSLPCGAFTNCGAISPVCAGSIDPTIVQQPGLTREQIATLKDALRKQISVLEEHEKTIGPKTAAEIDAREKALNAELADLAARKKSLKK
jgi:hypothetical protein